MYMFDKLALKLEILQVNHTLEATSLGASHYPYSTLFMGFGFFIMMFAEKFVHMCVGIKHHASTEEIANSFADISDHNMSKDAKDLSTVSNHAAIVTEKSFIKSIILLFGLSLDCVFEG